MYLRCKGDLAARIVLVLPTNVTRFYQRTMRAGYIHDILLIQIFASQVVFILNQIVKWSVAESVSG